MADKDLASYITRGILIGGSLGAFAGLAGLMHFGRAFGLGMLCGVLAGITMARRRDKKDRE